jgi:hypothetical protein
LMFLFYTFQHLHPLILTRTLEAGAGAKCRKVGNEQN